MSKCDTHKTEFARLETPLPPSFAHVHHHEFPCYFEAEDSTWLSTREWALEGISLEWPTTSILADTFNFFAKILNSKTDKIIYYLTIFEHVTSSLSKFSILLERRDHMRSATGVQRAMLK